jgi:hypothetical protein
MAQLTYGVLTQRLLCACQSGVWTAAGGSTIQMPMYLDISHYDGVPASCPVGWADNGVDSTVDGNYRRTCLPPHGQPCSVLYRNSGTGLDPASCPAGWIQADIEQIEVWSGNGIQRTCFTCS